MSCPPVVIMTITASPYRLSAKGLEWLQERVTAVDDCLQVHSAEGQVWVMAAGCRTDPHSVGGLVGQWRAEITARIGTVRS